MKDFIPAPDGRGGMSYVGPHAKLIEAAILGRQQPGALLLGTRVRKVASEDRDRTPEGTLGTVCGSIGGETVMIMGQLITYGYLVEWDNCPDQTVFTTDYKLTQV
jgi:hypothetical protein